MFNLEHSIAEWRRQMLAAGIKNPVPLEELEIHLRQDISALVSAGTPEPEAFHVAVSRLGAPAAVRSEFNKIKSAQILPVKIGSFLWLGAMLLMAALLARKLFDGRFDFFTYAHVLSVTAGYTAIFLMGIFGICYVCWRSSDKLSPVRRQSLNRAVRVFSQVALGLVIAGTLLGLPVSRHYFGKYWTWDPKEIGALCVFAWLVVLALWQRFRQTNDRAAMLLCIGGNIIVSVAWFGAGILDFYRKSGHGLENYWPLAIFLGIQLGFLAIGMVPNGQTTES